MPEERKPLDEMLKAKIYQLPEPIYEMILAKLDELERRSTELTARYEKNPADVISEELLTLHREYIDIFKSVGDLNGMEDRINELEAENEALRNKQISNEALFRRVLDAIREIKPYLEDDKKD
jgi:hypothetical protein